MKSIKDQVIVITGASSGIGLFTAKKAAKLGAKVVMCARNSLVLEEVVNQILSSGGQALAVTADVTKLDDLKNVGELALKAYGRIDTWVNNAGIALHGNILETSIEEEKKIFETNFWGVRNGAHVAIPALHETSGTRINIGSEISTRALPMKGIYSASKHAVKAYTDALRMELENRFSPVSISLICPANLGSYHPSIVAKAILECAENPTRDVFVGGSSKMIQILDVLAPRVVDVILESKINDDSKIPRVISGGDGAVGSLRLKSQSVLPLLSLGLDHLFKVGSYVAKPRLNRW